VLISLREDYLAPLEGLKSSMPSITQNRLRLAPMTGSQALEAVRRPGGRLVTEDVAAAIVRFVAGGAEIVNAEVEPSLLSLICRELNDKRIAEGRTEISLDLLAGSHATILAEFYERSLADQPAAVRRVDRGRAPYRVRISREHRGGTHRVVVRRGRRGPGNAAAAGQPAAAAHRGAARRAPRRAHARRVVRGREGEPRPALRARSARPYRATAVRAARARTRGAPGAQARAAHRSGLRGAGAGAPSSRSPFAFISLRRAHRAELAAQESRAAAETARSHAEHLLGYLNEDFAVELAGFGTLALIKQLGERETQYYDSLPASLQTTDSVRSAALARVHFGIAQQQAFDLKGARTSLTNAVTTLEQLRERATPRKSPRSRSALVLRRWRMSTIDSESGQYRLANTTPAPKRYCAPMPTPRTPQCPSDAHTEKWH
jgi:hypothetical protein